jgi:hypothetical protein
MTEDFHDWNYRASDVRRHLLSRGNINTETATVRAREKVSSPVMPWHSAESRVSPNDILRCGLFGVAQSRAVRAALHRHRYELQGTRGGHIEYTGQELRQSDGDVLMGLFHLEQSTPGVAVVSLRALAEAVGFGTSNLAVCRVEDAIIRMSASNLEINTCWKSSSGQFQEIRCAFSLVTGYRQVKKGVWAVYLPDELRELVQNSRYTRVCQSHLRGLNPGATLASWLLKFYSTHKVPKDLDINELHRLCGSSSKNKEFRRMLLSALEHLRNIDFLESYEVIGKMVKVVRSTAISVLDDVADSA